MELIIIVAIIGGLLLFGRFVTNPDEDGIDADLGDSRSWSGVTMSGDRLRACSMVETGFCLQECSGSTSVPEGIECINPAKGGTSGKFDEEPQTMHRLITELTITD